MKQTLTLSGDVHNFVITDALHCLLVTWHSREITAVEIDDFGASEFRIDSKRRQSVEITAIRSWIDIYRSQIVPFSCFPRTSSKLPMSTYAMSSPNCHTVQHKRLVNA